MTAKYLLDEKRHILELYEREDSSSLPGWAFLFKPVVNAYGVCPFLDVSSPEREVASIESKRQKWLEEREDRGQLFRECLRAFCTDQVARENADLCRERRAALRSLVSEKMTSQGFATHDALLETITAYRQSRTRNKNLKSAWENTLEQLRRIKEALQFDFAVYYDVLTNGKLSKATVSEIFASSTPVCRAMKEVMEADRAEKEFAARRENETSAAKDLLHRLILNNYDLGQQGRYFKPWHALSLQQKRDRIASYANQAIRLFPAAPPSQELTDWIMEAIASKKLRVADIGWSSKSGIVDDIKRLRHAPDVGFYLEPAEATKRTRSTRKTGRASDATDGKYRESLPPLDIPRLNRLLLAEILQYPMHQKERVVGSAVAQLRCPLQELQAAAKEQAQASYAKMVAVIQQHPLGTSANS
jgi:hypothetical protein